MKRATLPSLFFLLSLAPQALAQESLQENAQKAPPVSLERARTIFGTTDADSDGAVSLREAVAAGHSLAEFRAFDADGDGVVAQDEFLVGYAESLTGRGDLVARDFADETARIRARRQERRADAADAGNTEDGPERRSDALREQVRTGEIDPERAANRLENLRESNAAPGTARSRATNALSRLRESRQDRRVDALQDVRQARRADVADVADAADAAGLAASEEERAQDAAAGPAARRIAPSPEELRSVLRERQQRAAEESRRDPRAQAARERVIEQRREGTGSTIERGNARERAASDARLGRGRGPAGARSGGAVGSTRRSRGGN